MHSLTVVIPAFNEALTITQVINETLSALQRHFSRYEVVIMDDGSTDHTLSLLHKIQQTNPASVHVYHHQRNRGISGTLEHLFFLARMDYILDLSADGQINPTEVIGKIAPLLNQYDIIVCRRKNKHYGLYRSIVSICYRQLPKLLFGIDLYDPGCAKCTRREIRQNIQTTSKGILKEAERCIRAIQQHSFKLTTITINTQPRSTGQGTGAKPSLILEAMIDLTRFWLALRFKNRKTRA